MQNVIPSFSLENSEIPVLFWSAKKESKKRENTTREGRREQTKETI